MKKPTPGPPPTSASIRGMGNGARCALVTSECQSAIIDPSLATFRGLAEAAQAANLTGRIAKLAQWCRAASVPVIHCTIRLLPDARAFPTVSPLQAIMRRNVLLQRSRPESGLCPGLEADDTDLISDRSQGVTAFYGTNLESILRAMQVSTIILTGVSTNIALIGTSIEAINRGFSVVIPQDCTAGATTETHRHAIDQVLPLVASVTDSEGVRHQLPRSTGQLEAT